MTLVRCLCVQQQLVCRCGINGSCEKVDVDFNAGTPQGISSFLVNANLFECVNVIFRAEVVSCSTSMDPSKTIEYCMLPVCT